MARKMAHCFASDRVRCVRVVVLSTSNSTGICVRCVPVVFVPLTTLTIKTTNTSKAQARLPLKVFKLC
jgi:hypothetical protein